MVDGERVGRFGVLRPSVARAFDLQGPVVCGGFATEPLFALAPTELRVSTLPSFPPVLRDVALALPEDVAAADVVSTIRATAAELLESVTVLDAYRGPQVGEGRRSLAFRLTFRAPDRTLVAEEVDALRDAVVEAAATAHGAELR